MSFQSLDDIFRVITEKPEWELYRQYCHLVNGWHQVVADNVSRQTRVLYISRRVLWVATSSAVWAQNLMMQRYELLKKLNPLLPEPLIDIRFSSAHWQALHQPRLSNVIRGRVDIFKQLVHQKSSLISKLALLYYLVSPC
jgi:predicted nucleic acid-binding Zn ribbon protein